MNLHQLRIFTAVARLKSFTKASQELNLSQPSVSVQLKQLEELLDVKLVEKLGRTIILTDAGRILDEYAERIFALLAEAEEAIEDLKELGRGSLVVGASTTPGVYLVPRVMGAYRSRYPGVKLSLSISNTADIERRILRGELDIGFIGEDLEHADIVTRRIAEDEILLVVPSGGPTTGRGKTISLKSLDAHGFIMREQGSATRRYVMEAFAAEGFNVEPVMELNNPEAVKQAVKEGLGWSFISALAVQDEIREGRLAALKVKGIRITRPLNLIHRRGRRLSRAAEAFIALVEELRFNG